MNNIFVYIELEGGKIADVSLELLTKGRELAAKLGVKLEAVALGHHLAGIEKELAKYGADTVWVADDELFTPFRTLPHTAVMCGLIEQEKPQIALFGATPVGRDFAPRVSSALHSGLTADCTQLEIGDHKDAKTGTVLVHELRDNTLTYDDLEGCWGKNQALTLAEYGVGWQGGSLRPNDTLTQLDLVALLASTHGYSYSPDEDDADDLYAYAYRYGILTPEQRQDAAQVTRLELIQLLLDSAGYGSIARLEGIYRCDYTDADTIPAGQLGYAALAQGLGLVAGDSAGRFAPNRPATRVEAIAILYQFMMR